MQYPIEVFVSLRQSILDPQGKAVEHAAHSLNFSNVKDLRIGKWITFHIEASSEAEALSQANTLAGKLLVNPVMEDFSCRIKAGN